MYNLIITGNSISIQDGYLTMPQSRTYTSILNSHRIRIKIPERLLNKKIKEVKLIPLYKGRAFKIAYCYEVDEEILNLNRENSLAIDIGLDNLATCVTNFGTSFIMDGRRIKQINLDLDELPIFDAEKSYTGKFSGKRIKRGLYKSKSGKLINADVNGAANILRKSKQKVNFEQLCTGLLDSPLRIRVA